MLGALVYAGKGVSVNKTSGKPAVVGQPFVLREKFKVDMPRDSSNTDALDSSDIDSVPELSCTVLQGIELHECTDTVAKWSSGDVWTRSAKPKQRKATAAVNDSGGESDNDIGDPDDESGCCCWDSGRADDGNECKKNV